MNSLHLHWPHETSTSMPSKGRCWKSCTEPEPSSKERTISLESLKRISSLKGKVTPFLRPNYSGILKILHKLQVTNVKQRCDNPSVFPFWVYIYIYVYIWYVCSNKNISLLSTDELPYLIMCSVDKLRMQHIHWSHSSPALASKMAPSEDISL